eukprot:7286132-Pyramimonas_sp.AAC.1
MSSSPAMEGASRFSTSRRTRFDTPAGCTGGNPEENIRKRVSKSSGGDYEGGPYELCMFSVVRYLRSDVVVAEVNDLGVGLVVKKYDTLAGRQLHCLDIDSRKQILEHHSCQSHVLALREVVQHDKRGCLENPRWGTVVGGVVCNVAGEGVVVYLHSNRRSTWHIANTHIGRMLRGR